MKNIDFNNSKIAIVHDYFYWAGGAEKVVEALVKVFPKADVFTSFVHPSYKSWLPAENKLHTSIIQKLPLKQYLAPFYELFLPFVFENMNLQSYDIVISSTSIWAKGVIPPAFSHHISYIHCPPRFLWGYESSRQAKLPQIVKFLMYPINHLLRLWDYYSAQRPDVLIANSVETQERIRKHYKRESIVINPPVEMGTNPDEKTSDRVNKLKDKNFYLSFGRLVKYKRIDEIIKAFLKMPDKQLIIAGGGDERENLEKLAENAPNIKFWGVPTDDEKWALMKKTRALIHVAYEDFGIIPVEAMSTGNPVIGLNHAGTRETVIHTKTGYLIEEVTTENLISAIASFEKLTIDPKECIQRFQKYTFKVFEQKIRKIIGLSQAS